MTNIGSWIVQIFFSNVTPESIFSWYEINITNDECIYTLTVKMVLNTCTHPHSSYSASRFWWCVCVTMKQTVKCQLQNTDERIRSSDVIVSGLLHCWNSILRSQNGGFFIAISLMNAALWAQIEADCCNADVHLHIGDVYYVHVDLH